MPTLIPVPTPYQPPSAGGSPNAPVGQTGFSYSSNFIGPILNSPMSYSGGITNPQNQSGYVAPMSTTQAQKDQIDRDSQRPAQQQSQPTNWSNTSNWGFERDGHWFQTPDDYNRWVESQKRPWNAEYGMYEDEVQSAINDMFSGTSNYLNQAEGAVKANLPGQLGEITSAADLQKAKLGEGRQSTLDTIAANERGAQTRKEDALAAARRLYQELGQANIQRFGGSTSAGQAMNELQGREQQSQMGQTNRQYNEYMNQAATQKATLDREYQTGLQTIESEKQKATNSVNQAFQQSLLDIARDRATNESAKAQARLSALQDLRNKMFQISQQETQFKQSLEAQKQAAQLQIDSYLKTQGAASTGINNAYSQFNAGTQQALNPQTKYALQNMGIGQLQQPMYIGSIGKSITGRDENGNYIYSDGTRGPGGFLNQ